METFRLLRRQSIERLSSAEQNGFVEKAIGLWDSMAEQLIALVGEAGFDSLYARSVFLAQSTFPWLNEPAASTPDGHRFANLKANLGQQTPELAMEANRLLLVIFTDTLATLIGEPLTERVLNSAWGELAHYKTNKGENNA